jgi:hypothetical protein
MDEKKFSASGPDSVQPIWAIKGHEPSRFTHTCSRVGVMVWMGIGPNGFIGPRRIQGTLNSTRYTQLLKTVAPQLSNRGLDDTATCHSTDEAVQFWQDEGIENVRYSEQVPPKLVELNVQEQVWANIERRVWACNPAFPNANALWARICEVCDEAHANGEDKAWFASLTASIPRRMEAICKAKGKQLNLRRL